MFKNLPILLQAFRVFALYKHSPLDSCFISECKDRVLGSQATTDLLF